jgi:LytS/YehU family sensor histidine kinase
MRRGPYVLAVIAGTLTGAVAQGVMVFLVRDIVRPPHITAYLALELLMLAGGLVFIYYDRRRAHAALGLLHAAELDRVAASKRMLGSRLQAMQARAEPQFLLNTLAQVKALYQRDPRRGERVLDALIAYLRAAMPSMRDTTSTVGRECDLARAFLGIARVRMEDRLDFVIEIHDGAGEAKLPPMMLIPLVERLVEQPRTAPRRVSIRVEVRPAGPQLHVTIASTEASLDAASAVIGGIRERLAALYGEQATLLVRHVSGEATEAVLTVPHEPVAAAPEASEHA